MYSREGCGGRCVNLETGDIEPDTKGPESMSLIYAVVHGWLIKGKLKSFRPPNIKDYGTS